MSGGTDSAEWTDRSSKTVSTGGRLFRLGAGDDVWLSLTENPEQESRERRGSD